MKKEKKPEKVYIGGQAVMEGVAFAIRDCVEIARSQGIVLHSSTLCGGGARSRIWRTILANVLGITLQLPQTEQGPGYGAAMLAAVACGAFADVKSCADALVCLLSSRDSLGWVGSEILSCEQGYVHSETASSAMRFVPVWRIETDAGTFHVSGITREVRQLVS